MLCIMSQMYLDKVERWMMCGWEVDGWMDGLITLYRERFVQVFSDVLRYYR